MKATGSGRTGNEFQTKSQCGPRAPRGDALPSPLRPGELNDAPPAREGRQRADGTLNRTGQAGGEAGMARQAGG